MTLEVYEGQDGGGGGGGNQPKDTMLFLEFKFGYIIALCT